MRTMSAQSFKNEISLVLYQRINSIRVFFLNRGDTMAYGDKLSYKRRKRRSLKLDPKLIIAILVIVFLFLCLIGQGTFSRIGCQSDQTAGLKNYVEETKKVTAESNKLGKDFTKLRNSISEISRDDLEKQLTTLKNKAEKIEENGQKIEVPSEFETASLYFLVSLDLRTSALEKIKPAIFNALGDKDLEVSGKQVSLALKDIALSDRAFAIFHSKVEDTLKRNKVSDISAPSSVYLTAGNEYEMANVLEFLQGLKGSETLTPLHGVAITEILVEPEAVSEEDDINYLPNADTISITVTIENQGNEVEINVPVEVTLKSETDPEPRKKKKTIGSIAPGKTKSVSFTDLKPTTGDITNLLTISAGPVANEKFIDNNVIEYKFTMKRE